MLKRWAAWPRGIQWAMGGIAVVVLVLAIASVLFVPIADWLAHHDVGSVRGLLHETAVDNARGRLLTLAAGVFAAGALAFTARNFTLSRRTLDLTEQGQVTDRYTKAIEQLGSDKLDVRIGGIYALERVARDSARDHSVVMEVFTAFIREHSRDEWPGGRERDRSTRADVQAAVTAVGRRNAERDILPVNLAGADLSGADLSGADLVGARLTGATLARARFSTDINSAGIADVFAVADLSGADLRDADLRGARLPRANLYGVLGDPNLAGADLTEAKLSANLSNADFTRAWLTDADLSGAMLFKAVFTGADLQRANLAEANLTEAILADANLAGADLSGAQLSGVQLSGANLTGVRWPEDTPVPEGWKRNTSSGRLERATIDSGPAEAS